MALPFDGGISRYYTNEAPNDVREVIASAGKSNILNANYPYEKRWDKQEYESALEDLQIELVRMQSWAKETGQRIAIIFEGRDAAGKGGWLSMYLDSARQMSANVGSDKHPNSKTCWWTKG